MNRGAACLIAAIALLALSCSRTPESSAPSAPTTEHVVIITIDTLRADRVGAYGYAPASTPALDSLAKNGVRFDRAFAAAPITQTSHATLLTGRYPQGHGARHNGIRINDNVLNAKNPSGFTARVNVPSTGLPDPNFLRPSSYSGDFQRPEQRVGQIGFRFTF